MKSDGTARVDQRVDIGATLTVEMAGGYIREIQLDYETKVAATLTSAACVGLCWKSGLADGCVLEAVSL